MNLEIAHPPQLVFSKCGGGQAKPKIQFDGPPPFYEMSICGA